MDKRAIECYAMIGSKEPIIKWLKDEGVKTKAEARAKLDPIKGGIALGTLLSGSRSSSTFDLSSSFLDRIVDTFE
jgi:hypothetical protein